MGTPMVMMCDRRGGRAGGDGGSGRAAWLGSLVGLALLLLAVAPLQAQTFSLFNTNATWRYLKGTNEASLPDKTAWRRPGFGEGAWSEGAAPFFYGEIYLAPGTLLSDMQDRYATIFLRRAFVLTNADEIAQLELTAACDDGFVAWINGQPVASANPPAGELTFNAVARTSAAEPPPFVGYPLVDPGAVLLTGTNVLAVQVFNVSFASSDLVFDAALTAGLKEHPDPRVLAVSPLPESTLTQLTQITVTFSKPVTGVDAADLWLNETPCAAVSGGGATYTFTFPQPAWSTVQASWDMRHGITDLSQPANPFNPTGPGARWYYELFDPAAPKLIALNPPPGATVRQFRQCEVLFDKPVEGVDPSDLALNGSPAVAVTGAGAGPYLFAFPPQPPGALTLAWAEASGIRDLTPEAHLFQGEPWSYTVDPQLPVPDLVINEFVAENVSGLKDEEGDWEDWIEIYNRGDTGVNLAGWSLTDDAQQPGQWVFPAVTLPARRYLVVFASGKDRRSTAANARLHTNFKLGIAGEYLGLYNAESPRLAVSEVAPQYPAQRNDVAFGRDPLEVWRYFPTPTPGAANAATWITSVVEPVHFSVPRGFFTRAFNLSLATPTPGASIRYTLDGSVPSPTNGIAYTNPLAVAQTRVIRAAAFRSNSLPSTVTTHTYLFNQSSLRRTLPALSLVTATNNLYGRTGIMEYNPRNTLNHGLAWERPVSAEWIRPEDNGGFQVDCGLRLQGGGYIRGLYNYRSTAIPESKYSFRLYFRGDYGEGRLRQAIFPEVPVEEFDTIVLRAGMNDATNPFLRDELARRLEADVGQVSARGTFVHLFLNGVYKGYYNPTERIDDDFLRTWHGGTNNWDLIAMGGEVREGDATTWNALRSYASANNLALADKYLELERRLDTTNFVEYLIPLIYGDTDDWPHNNWRAARERTAAGRFRFYAWDAEWSFGYNNDVTHNTISGQLSNLSPPWGGSEIQTLFIRLKASPEFRLLFADRVHKHFFNGGAMTDERIRARYTWLKSMIAPAISGYNDSIGTGWITSRRRYLTNHLALAGLLASSNAPVFSQFGGVVPRGHPLTLTAGVGTIYYTTNGADPRERFTGAVAPGASASTPGTPLVIDSSLLVRARTRWSTNWSAVTEAAFQVDAFGLPLRISELMYHPSGGEEYEFIELVNTSPLALDLSGIHLEGVEFGFPMGTVLAGGARLVLISDANPDAFARRYPGVPVFGRYRGSLSNRGERLALIDSANRTIVSVNYQDAGGWPAAADGAGWSLEIVDAQGDPDDPANWQASAQAGGSPGASNPAAALPQVRLSEVAAAPPAAPQPGALANDWCELFNAGPTDIDLTGWNLNDGSTSRRMLFPAMTLPAGQHLVISCDTNTEPAGLHSGFGLDRQGDRLFLEDATGRRVDALRFGPQAEGFSLARVGEAQAWALAEPTPGAANAPASLAPPSALAINEFMANAVPGANDWIELYNTDPDRPAALQGLSLGVTNALFRITSLSFVGPAGYVLLPADEGDGPDHLDFRLPAARSYVVLHDPNGRVLNQASYTNAIEGVSLGRLPDGNTNLVAFTLSPTPGTTNRLVEYRGVVLAEILARNRTQSTNASGHTADWIELFNPGASAVSLAGMSLSVDVREGHRWVFPPGVVLGPAAYLVVWCDPERPASASAEPELNCGVELPDEGGGIQLFSAAGPVVDGVTYGQQLADRSFGRFSGIWMLLSRATPGAPNAAPAELGDPLGVRLNEWMAAASGDDWIELHNPGSLPVNLAGMVLTDDASMAGQTNDVIGALSFIDARGWAAWIADGDVTRGPNHLPFSLDALGETVRLYAAGQALVDSVDLLVQWPGVSEGRFPDGATNIVRFLQTPSPGTANYLELASVVIHEILANARPPYEPAIELLNRTASPVDLGGWWLGDGWDRPDAFRFPSAASIPAFGHVVVYAKDFEPGAGAVGGFRLDPWLGGLVVLSQADAAGLPTGYRSVARYGVVEPNMSVRRVETSVGIDFAAALRPTFGVDQPATVASFRTGRGAPNAPVRVGPVVISEIMYDPVLRVAAGLVDYPEAEFVELHNPTGAAVALFDAMATGRGWRLSGAVAYEFAPETSLAPGEFLLVVGFDPAQDPTALAAFRAFHRIGPGVRLVGPYTGRLANEGERLLLERPFSPPASDGPPPAGVPYAVVDAVAYAVDLPWPPAAKSTGRSLHRNSAWAYGNEAMNWHAGWPSPGGDAFEPAPDADHDGLPDEWELLHGLDPAVATGAQGPDGDPDNDGLPNRLELAHETDPWTKDLVIAGITAEPDGVHLEFNMVAGRAYTIEDREILDGSPWRLLTNLLPSSTSRMVELKFPLNPGPVTRYFRVRLQ